ncbi:MAG: glycerol-3-phosphate 1-O-acyltransferase [Deltaproteobacteria bacterium]|nr:glycerol-3-phosphate 1-O-acyltransferase [Deltaproteobacteria bacterium]
MATPRLAQPTPEEPTWPGAERRPIVFLLDVASGLERKVLERWIAAHRPADASQNGVEAIAIPSARAGKRKLDPKLEARLAIGDDPLMAPLRIAWQPPEIDGVHRTRLRDLLSTGDPRDPGRLRQRWVLRRHPERCRVVAGEPAPLSQLRERWQRACGTDAAQTTGLADFVALQATLALERAERRLRGTRYKVPRFVRENIEARPSFRGGVARLAREIGKPEGRIAKDASRYLREIAATHSPYVIDLTAHLIRLLYTRGYGEALHYDHDELEKVYTLAQRHPVVFLPSHKSNLDHLVLQYALHENGHPPNHTAGGINMNFFPVGPLVRRSGVFFIRRSFKDNPVYKFVLRQYIDYLIEKRFSLEWYIEGGRSRSGKLLPPMFGMLHYVVDAYRRGKSEDVYLIPVAIAYDQIQDVDAYVAEQRGGAKSHESFGWFLGVVRQLRRRYGDIHINFGAPVSLQAALGPPEPGAEPKDEEQTLQLQKLAFQVAVRINRVTPITPTSLVTMALLGGGGRAFTVAEILRGMANLLSYVRRRALPITSDLNLDDEADLKRALDTLVESKVVTAYAAGLDTVYQIAPEQEPTAAYYRNTIIHFFVNGALAELALLEALEREGEPQTRFWDAAMGLRDLMKFEFFFAEKDEFRTEVDTELRLHDPDWEHALSRARPGLEQLIRRIRPFSAHRVLRPFLESYRVVADGLARREPAAPFDEPAFIASSLALARQYQLQKRVHSGESVSKVLFATALRLARNRKLVDPGPDLAERRQRFAAEIRDALRRVDAIGALAQARRVGLID